MLVLLGGRATRDDAVWLSIGLAGSPLHSDSRPEGVISGLELTRGEVSTDSPHIPGGDPWSEGCLTAAATNGAKLPRQRDDIGPNSFVLIF